MHSCQHSNNDNNKKLNKKSNFRRDLTKYTSIQMDTKKHTNAILLVGVMLTMFMIFAKKIYPYLLLASVWFLSTVLHACNNLSKFCYCAEDLSNQLKNLHSHMKNEDQTSMKFGQITVLINILNVHKTATVHN